MPRGGIVAGMRTGWLRLRVSNGHRGPASSCARAALLAALCFIVAGVGCGHPATREECEAIFQRSAEIELRAQNVTDPKVIAERTAAVREARGQALIDRCTGRRITDRALECVRQATTPQEVDRCLE